MRIVILVEGKTEKAFMEKLREFLDSRLSGQMPRLVTHAYDGRIPKEGKLQRVVGRYLKEGADAVVALTDVYTGTDDFADATDARTKMRQWTGNMSGFHAHAAQHDFEAWLLPYWSTIQKLAKHNKKAPPGPPEDVNHNSPPSRRIAEIFELGNCRDSYVKVRDARRILKDNDLLVSAQACPELKGFLNTILDLCGGHVIP